MTLGSYDTFQLKYHITYTYAGLSLLDCHSGFLALAILSCELLLLVSGNSII